MPKKIEIDPSQMTIDEISQPYPSTSDADREFDRLDGMGIFTGRQAREMAGIVDETSPPIVEEYADGQFTELGLKMAGRVGHIASSISIFPPTYSPLRNTSRRGHRERRRD